MQMNLFDDDGWLERTWPPEKPGFLWRRKRVAGEHLGASLYELMPGSPMGRAVRNGSRTDRTSWSAC